MGVGVGVEVGVVVGSVVGVVLLPGFPIPSAANPASFPSAGVITETASVSLPLKAAGVGVCVGTGVGLGIGVGLGVGEGSMSMALALASSSFSKAAENSADSSALVESYARTRMIEYNAVVMSNRIKIARFSFMVSV